MIPPHLDPRRAPTTPLPTERRVFSIAIFLAGVGVAVGSIALFLLLKALIDDGVRVRGRGAGMLILALLAGPLVGLGMMVFAFFRAGCSACKRALTTRRYPYPATMFPYLAERLARGGGELETFLRAPIEAGPHRAVLSVEVCPSCEQLANVRLHEEVPGKDGPDELRGIDARALTPHELPWIAALRANRSSW